MCDASNFMVGAFLGQQKEKVFYAIYYASRTLNDTQQNYATIEKELLAIVFAFDKFRRYLTLPYKKQNYCVHISLCNQIPDD